MSRETEDKVSRDEYWPTDEDDSAFIIRARLARMARQNGPKKAKIPNRTWLAKISIQSSSTDTVFHECTGVLLNARYVLTAARCVCNVSLLDCSDRPSDQNAIWTAGGNRPQEKIKVDFFVLSNESKPLASFSGRRAIVYNGYVEEKSVGDVALIELNTTKGVPR